MHTDLAPSIPSHQRRRRVSQVEAPHLPLWTIRKCRQDGRTSTQHPRVRFPLSELGYLRKKRHASFNRSLILGHMVYSCGGRWYPDSHKSHSAVRAEAGLTNLNTIFQLNNLALPRGRPAPDRALRSEASLVFSVWAQWLSADEHCPGRSEAEVCPLLTTGNNEKFLRGHQRN